MTEREGPGTVVEGSDEQGGLARAIESAGLGILSCDRASGAVTWVNAPGGAILRSMAVERGPDPADLLARSALASEAGIGASTGGRPRSLDLGGRVLGFSLYPSPDVLWVFFRDVTEKVRLDEVAGSRQLADSLLGVFSTLRHEVGNPVNSAKTSLAVLRNGLGRLDEEAVRRYVDRALESLAHVEAVLGTLRDYGFVTDPQPRAVRVSEIVERAVLECGPALALGGVALTIEADEPILAAVADPVAAEQALCALLRRAAREATPESPVELVLSVEGRSETVAVGVSSRATAGSDEAGTDLGLLVVRRLASLMGGTLEADGAGVRLVLRRAEAAP